MRLVTKMAGPARIIAGVLAAMMFISIFDAGAVTARKLTPQEKAQQIADQEAREKEARTQRELDQQDAEQQVDEQIAKEELNPGKASNLRATTLTSVKGLTKKQIKDGYRYVTLRWKGTENATKYFVYYRIMGKKGFKKKGSAVTTCYKKKMLFKDNREVFLKVKAATDERTGKFSESVVIWPGYGSYVNATKIKIAKGPSVLFAGYTGKYVSNSSASMLKTYKVEWTSSNRKVAKIGRTSGVVTALKKGRTVITGRSHAGFKVSKTLRVRVATPKEVPNVRGLSRSQAKKVMNQAGFKVSISRKFVKKSVMKKKYGNVEYGKIYRQNLKAGTTVQQGTTIKLYYAEKLYYFGKGVENMVRWAEAVARDDSYGYSMGVYTGRGLDRLCPYTNAGASKDYDCATFVNAALAFSGMGDDFMRATHKPSPVVGGVKALMLRNGWKKIKIKSYYWSGGKKVTYYRKPYVSELKRGDIVLDVHRHIQIHVGNGKDVGAHNDYSGRSGDPSGHEISIGPSWTGYAEAFRYYGNIGK